MDNPMIVVGVIAFGAAAMTSVMGFAAVLWRWATTPRNGSDRRLEDHLNRMATQDAHVSDKLDLMLTKLDRLITIVDERLPRGGRAF